MTGDLEDLSLLVEVDGIDGEAHEAHVYAVAGRNEQAGRGRQGTAKHQAGQPRPERIGNMNPNRPAIRRISKRTLLQNRYALLTFLGVRASRKNPAPPNT